jgi:sugar-specific transcriptional regulator TrmB
MSARVDDKIVESLQELGLSLYEARLYLGLLTGGPQNGNELSRTSGVPSSKVYAMLERLAAEGVVASTRRGSTVEYVCVPPNDLLYKLRERYSKPLDYLEETLPTLGTSRPEPDILQVQGVEAIIDHARAIIRAAEQEIYLSIWEENVASLRADLDEADGRGVRIAGMLYGVDTPLAGWWQRHSYRETVASRILGRMLTMVRDGEEALVAHIPKVGEASAVRTKSPVLTLVAEEYLIHDMTLQKAKTMTGYEEWDGWLQSDDQVRSLTLGRTGRMSPIEPEAEVRT